MIPKDQKEYIICTMDDGLFRATTRHNTSCSNSKLNCITENITCKRTVMKQNVGFNTNYEKEVQWIRYTKRRFLIILSYCEMFASPNFHGFLLRSVKYDVNTKVLSSIQHSVRHYGFDPKLITISKGNDMGLVCFFS